MFIRNIQNTIENHFFKQKCIIIYGARQVGKTTMIKTIMENYPTDDTLFLNCDETDIRNSLTNATSTNLQLLLSNRKIIFIDEAQRVPDIGLTLKLLVDNFPDVQVIATGSSSFDLSNSVTEPLTGRKYEFQLFPLSLTELTQKYSLIEIRRILERKIIFGMYPEVETKPEDSSKLLRELSSSYLFKDVFQFQDIRRPEMLEKLLTALALQIGQEVSFKELSNLLGVSKETVSNYIQLLEKAFVIYRLPPFSRNIRNELKRLRKIYFYDTGVRNALINNLNPMHLRQDKGQLWENFIISERLKRNSNNDYFVNTYFWRTHKQQEIDYIEEEGGILHAFEIKWQKAKKKIPNSFIENYPNSKFQFITQENFEEFVGL